MIKRITLLFLAFTCFCCLTFAQTTLNNFEDVNPTVDVLYGATFENVSNPNTTGNTSTNVGKLGRTNSNWYELIRFPISNYNVPANTIKYLHVLVNYPAQPDVSVRFDANSGDLDGTIDIRAMNEYNSNNEWQDLVFELDGGTSGVTVEYIIFLFDLGFQNLPPGQILNNSDAFGYIDNFVFTDSSIPLLSNKDYDLEKTSIYPNPINSIFKINFFNKTNIKNISIFNALGNELVGHLTKLSKNEYCLNGLSSGIYILKIEDVMGSFITRKIIKN